MKRNIFLPEEVRGIIDKLSSKGYTAYAVGGCVRDSIMGNIPHDWDICTDAVPNEVKQVFAEYRVIETGIKHGTVTVMIDRTPFEITTFRSETTYSDNRHPDEVIFEKYIGADLSRRDFTVNAIAYNPYEGFIDLYGGIGDIENKVIKAVGNCAQRFEEDALRILRALRFSSVLNFKIDEDTARNIHCYKHLLNNIAAERIRVEFCKLLMGENAVSVLREYADVIAVFIPQTADMAGFEQHNPHHRYDVWEHTLHALNFAEKDLSVRLAVLFHDIGKPYTFSLDENRIGHFYAHAKKSTEITAEVLDSLKFDNHTKNTVLSLVKHHDRVIEMSEKSVKRTLHKVGSEEMFEKLLQVKLCDIQAQAQEFVPSRTAEIKKITEIYTTVKKNDDVVFSVKNLAVNGKDVMHSLKIDEGKQVGIILEKLLECVLNGEVENTREALLEQVKGFALKNPIQGLCP